MLDQIITLYSIHKNMYSKSPLSRKQHLLDGSLLSYENGINYKWMFFGTFALLILQFVFILFNKWKKKTKSLELDIIEDNYIQFNEVEKNLIRQIIDQSKKQKYFTVTELNMHLGVKNKSIEIQKKIRNDAIIRINHKFNVNFNVDTVFIERIRSIADRRYFNYFINEENTKIYLKGNH